MGREVLMITVSISVNGGQPIYARTAVRIEGKEGETCIYYLDDGSKVKHKYDDGAVALAIKMLRTIQEVKKQETEQCKGCGRYINDCRCQENAEAAARDFDYLNSQYNEDGFTKG